MTAPYMQHAALAGSSIALAAGLIGYFLVLRSQVFTTDALGHVTYTGAMCGLAFAFNPLAGLFVATVAVAGGFAVLGRRARADDVVIGSTFAWVLGLGALVQRLYTTRHSGGNGRAGATYLFGSIFGISSSQAVVSAAVSLLVCAVMIVIARPLLFASVDPVVAAARARHAAHFLEFARTAQARLNGADQAVWVRRLEREHPNLRAALQWGLESNHDEFGLRKLRATLEELRKERDAVKELALIPA